MSPVTSPISEIFPLLFIAVAILVVFKFFLNAAKTANRGPNLRASPANFSSRMGDDGFWINGPSSATGHRVYYTCVVDGREIHDFVVFTPGPEGQFVFTGGRPTTVALQPTRPSSSDWSTSSDSFSDGMVMSGIERNMSDETPYQLSSSNDTPSFPQAY